jgi:hypothetical protein
MPIQGENRSCGAWKCFAFLTAILIEEPPMNDALTPELWQAERARRATRNAAIAALAAFALSRREAFKRFLAGDGEEPEAFIGRWVEGWADAYRLRRTAIVQLKLASPDTIATERAYERAGELLRFVAEDLENARDSKELAALLKKAGLYERKTRQGYIDTAPGTEHPLRDEFAAALRELIENGTLPLNHPGAAVWRIEDDLWLVAAQVARALQGHWRFSGQDLLPVDRLSLLQLLLNAGLLIPGLEGGPTWHRDITPVGHAVSFHTLVRIPVQRLWSDPASAPRCFKEEPFE